MTMRCSIAVLMMAALVYGQPPPRPSPPSTLEPGASGPMVNWSPCTGQCDLDNGTSTATVGLCADGISACRMAQVTCNTNTCQDEWSEYDDCNASCNGGTRRRVNLMTGVEQISFCNLHPCEAAESDYCSLNIFYAIDGTASVGEERYNFLKRMAADIISYIDIPGVVHSAFSFDRDVREIFSNHIYGQPAVTNLLENHPYLGGTGAVCNVFAHLRDEIALVNPLTPKVVLFFTDSPDTIKIDEYTPLATTLKNTVDMHVVQIGKSMDILLFAANSDQVYPVTHPDSSGSIINNVLSRHCGVTKKEINIDNGLNKQMNDTLYNDVPTSCDLRIFVPISDCVTNKLSQCDVAGKQNFSFSCDTYKEKIVEIEQRLCRMPPCTTPMPTTTTTQDPESETDKCRMCTYQQGQGWYADELNCHMYYICLQRKLRNGDYVYTRFRRSCGNRMFWNQRKLTCVTRRQPGCELNSVPTETPIIMDRGECDYVATANGFAPRLGGQEMPCSVNTEFNEADCACVHVINTVKPDCDQDMILHFPYTDSLDDVTCTHASGMSYGEGEVKLVWDQHRNEMVAEFDGLSRIEIPYMRNWLTGKNVNGWTMTAWVWRQDTTYPEAGIVDNGDCFNNATYAMYADTCEDSVDDRDQKPGYGIEVLLNLSRYQPALGESCVYGGVAAGEQPPTYTDKQVIPNEVWTHVAMIYDGQTVNLYVNKALVKTTPKTGVLLSNHNPMYIGMKGCCEEHFNYFKGRIDDVRIWRYAISQQKLDNLP